MRDLRLAAEVCSWDCVCECGAEERRTTAGGAIKLAPPSATPTAALATEACVTVPHRPEETAETAFRQHIHVGEHVSAIQVEKHMHKKKMRDLWPLGLQ